MHSTKKATLAWIGGVVAALVLVVAGAAYIVIGVNGRNEVRDTIAREQIVGTPDMTPEEIAKTAEAAGLDVATLQIPENAVAGVKIDTGQEAKDFAGYMRIHALESTKGLTYAEMGRFLDVNGNPTSDESKAAINPETKRPVENGLRNLWVTETALATGLNMSFFAEQVSIFAIVMGILMILIGVGLFVLCVAAFGLTPWKTAGGDAAAGTPPAAA
jgi:flagellar basal body-associated protein FliL